MQTETSDIALTETETSEETGSEDATELQTEEETVLADDDDKDITDYTTLVMATENAYYYYGNTLYIIAKLSNCDISKADLTFYIDGKACGEDAEEPFGKIYKDDSQEGYYVIILKKGDLKNTPSNSHNLSLSLTKETADGGIRELVKREAVFTTIEQEIFLEKTPYYMGVSDDSVEVTIFDTADDIAQIALSNNGETVAAPTEDSEPVKDSIKTDPRYTGICSEYEFPKEILNGTNVLLYKSVWTLTNLKNAIDLGSYNLNLIFDNGETMDISGAVSITADAVVTNCTVAVDYDNTSPYAYLFIQGSGFNPSRVTYAFRAGSASGTALRSTIVSYKEVMSGYIVKFRKTGNWPQAGEDIYVSLKGNNIWFSKSEFTSTVKSGIYYAAYNPVIKAIEAGVADDLTGKRIQFSIVKSSDDANVNPATTSSLTDSLIYLTPKNPLTAGMHYVKLVVDGDTENPYTSMEFNVDEKALNISRWDAPKVISKNAERHYFYYYYEEAGITSSDLSAKITDENGVTRDASSVSASEWLREDAGKGTCIKVVIPTQKLDIGKYKVEIFKTIEGVTSSIDSYDFELVASKNNKFVLDEYSISWINDDAMQVYIRTPNCSEEDDFDIKLTETSGKEVSDLSTVVTNRYSDSIYMEVTGLKRTKAFRDYYVLLTHKNKDYQDLGYPFKMSNMTESYYTDKEKGELKTIAFNRGMPIKVTANNRVVGINLQFMTLPATVNLYAPNDTDVKASLTITAATEDDFYYFTKEFFDSLPNKDTLYDMVISDADGWGRTYPGVTIGYREEIVENDFRVAISTDMLFLGVEGEDTAVITVTGNTQNPNFEVADESILTVTADEEDPNQAVVKAAEKTGTTVVTIFADGVEKSIIVTVTAQVAGIELDTSNKKMWVGDTLDVEVYTLPIGSGDATHRITFTSSDPSVLYVKQLSATTARITAMGSGTATLHASLNGTTHVTNMSVTVTGMFSLAEKKEKIAQAGIGSYIENIDRTLEYCELPEGWAWDDGSVSLSANDDITIQYYGATYTQEGYESFSARLPVAVTRITGINIEGRNLVNRGKEETYQVTYDYVGRDITWEEIDKRLSVNCVKVSNGDIAEVTSVDKKKIVITTKEESEGGIAEFRFTLSIDNGTIEGSDMLVKTFSVTVPLEDCVDNIVLKPVKTDGQTFTFSSENKLMELDVNEVRKADGKYPVSIALEATINGVPAKNISYSWQSDNEAVASFAKDKDGKPVTDKSGNVVLTIKNTGFVQITATADDPGAFVGTMTIHIMDYEPVLETPVVTVNKNSTVGAGIILQEQNGNSIRRVRVLEGSEESWAESQNFAVNTPDSGRALLTIKDNAPVKGNSKKTTASCMLEVETTKGGRYQYPLTVITEVTVPKVTVKLKTKANLFYNNAEAVYTISSNCEIESVKVKAPENGKGFYLKKYDKANKTITLYPKGTLDSATVGLFTTSATLQIKCAGYDTQEIAVKVGTENKKPKLSITDFTVCPGMSSGIVNVADAKTKERVSITDLTMSKPVAGLAMPTMDGNGGIKMFYNGSKSASYTVSVRSKEWTQAVDVKGKIVYVKSPDKLPLVLGSKQLTLNMMTNTTDNGVISIPVSVGGIDIPIADLECGGTAKTLIDSGVLLYKFDAKAKNISLGLPKNRKNALKAGNYKLDLTASVAIGGSMQKVKKATLVIKITEEKAAKVTMASPKGKINLIERDTTSIVYTPKVSGIESAVKSAVVTGDNKAYFTAALNEEKKVEVKARPNVGMSSKSTYNVTITSTLENGCKINTVVKIKPVNKTPKIVLNPEKGSLYRTNSNKYVALVSFKDSSLGTDSIASVTLDTSSAAAKNFSLTNDLSKNGTIGFSLAGDRTKMKQGTYKLKCQVLFKNADAQIKPTVINVTITIK